MFKSYFSKPSFPSLFLATVLSVSNLFASDSQESIYSDSVPYPYSNPYPYPNQNRSDHLPVYPKQNRPDNQPVYPNQDTKYSPNHYPRPSQINKYEGREEVAYEDNLDYRTNYSHDQPTGDWDYKESWRHNKEAFFKGKTQAQAYREAHPYGPAGIGYDADEEYLARKRANHHSHAYYQNNDHKYRNHNQDHADNRGKPRDNPYNRQLHSSDVYDNQPPHYSNQPYSYYPNSSNFYNKQ